MLTLIQKLQKLLEIIEDIRTGNESSEGLKKELMGYLNSWIDSLPDEK